MPRYDPTVVRWVANFETHSHGEFINHDIVRLHECTEEDYAKFYPPDETASNTVKKFKEKGGLFCIDWTQVDFSLFGHKSDQEYTFIDIAALACGTPDTVFPKKDADPTVRDDC